MDRWDIQRLRELPIEGVALRLGLQVVRHKALCPFHADRHPSLSFYARLNIYHCFVCGAKGTTIDLVMRHLNKSFVEACQWLAQGSLLIHSDSNRLNVSRNRSSSSGSVGSSHSRDRPELDAWERRLKTPVLTDEAKQFLFAERHLHPAVIRWLGISSTHRDLLIPYRDLDGRLLTLQQRYLGKDKRHPRFIFLKGSGCTFYNLPVLHRLKDGDDLYFSEGVTDCMALLSSGHKTIGVPSATSLNRCDWTPIRTVLEGLPHVHLHFYPDRDEPGERLFLQLRQHFPALIRHQLPSGCKDFSDFYCSQQNALPKQEVGLFDSVSESAASVSGNDSTSASKDQEEDDDDDDDDLEGPFFPEGDVDENGDDEDEDDSPTDSVSASKDQEEDDDDDDDDLEGPFFPEGDVEEEEE